MESYRYNVSVSIIEPGTILDTSIRQKNLTKILENEQNEQNEQKELESVPKSVSTSESVVHSDYEEWFTYTRNRLKRADAERIGDPPIIVSEAIYHAIHSKYPKTRYIIGKVGRFPCWVMDFLKTTLPDRIFDMLLLAAPGSG